MNKVLEEGLVIKKVLWRYVLMLLAFLSFGVLAYRAAGCFYSCIDVLRYTVPAIRMEDVNDFSLADYWQETGLMEHFICMPSSAQKYYVLRGVACGIYAILAVVAFIGGCSMVCRTKKIHICGLQRKK